MPQAFLVSEVSIGKSVVILMGFPVYVTCGFSLDAFSSCPLLCIVSALAIACPGSFFSSLVSLAFCVLLVSVLVYLSFY